MTLSKTSRLKVSTVFKRGTALELRRDGHTLQEIADRLECSRSYVYKLISSSLIELSKQSHQAVVELRELESMRLDALWEQAYTKAMNGDLAAINTCVRISERRSKLWGLDGVQKLEHSGGVTISLQLADCSKRE
ncbi:hypothetical protein Metho_0690 [Methanomethylovorans hollandica DSM 15978]|uniref:Uncharacterized protein n=1 Tax=Methanomethylovorans hollandica (strain DSM 15978 / NBRC 107637 / DMS1) TaxID=867904 RepID=L0KW78_METHD|nr:helix-turn-helix domain-containing protein [Methanomethylovorans hollandica]AGB48945.1 hypothetical protein Metho_0690 [Methanomethylovorans hollandica DSM 15978]